MVQVEKQRILSDRAKRAVIDVGQRIGRLQTPMTQLLGSLQAYESLPAPLTALELFGMHGLWHTRDYVGRCRALDLYELNSAYAEYAARTLPRTRVMEEDSIEAVNTGALPRPAYNFIVIDNPVEGAFGPGYVEHFDLFPEVLALMEDPGVLVLNYIHRDVDVDDDHARRRQRFYGSVHPSVDEAAEVYRAHARDAGHPVRRHLYTYRNATMGYLALICGRSAAGR
jgi:hypothetical protein